MSDKIFGKNNPNDAIFCIPSEEGADSDDKYNASIGDATLQHISSLYDSGVRNVPSSKPIIYEHFICMPDGNLFSIEENLSWTDLDEFNMRTKQDIKGFAKQSKIPEKYLPIYEEALQNELSKQEASEDVLDQKDNLVSYEDWEANPGLSGYWDIPQTPKPHIKYAGNCRQMFYDSFPEDHPDAQFINSIISSINVDWDSIGPKFVRMITRRIENTRLVSPDTGRLLIQMIQDIEASFTTNPEEIAINALDKIDRAWFKSVFTKVKQEEMKTDPIYQHLNKMCQEFDLQLKAGVNVNKIYAVIKQMGKTFFAKKEPLKDKGISGRLHKRHWVLYRKMKKRYAPEVMVNGINLNKAYRSELAKALVVSFDVARLIIINRPFESLEELRRTGLVSLEDIARKDSNIVKFLDRITAASSQAIQNNDAKFITKLPSEFIKEQKELNTTITPEQWKNIWECYNITKTKVLKTIHR